jgi:hypothetical protein
LAVAQKESNFNQGARGTSGEVGMFQLMPATAAGLKVDAYDQTANINGGTNPPASSYSYAQSVLDISQVYGPVDSSGVDASYGSDYSLASITPDLSGVPNWAWLAALGVAALLLLLKRD